MVIITGLGRCGTSVLSLFLSKMGYDVGGEWIDKYDAGMEDETVTDLNANLLGKKNKLSKSYINKVIKSYPKQIVKDPRFVYESGLCLRHWYSVRQDLKVLFLHRNFTSMYKSRKSKIGDSYLPDNVDEWKKDFADFHTFVIKERIPMSTLFFPNFLSDYLYVYETLMEVDIHFDYKAGKEQWEQLIDLDKVHYR